MARKNGMIGSIPGAGRPVENNGKVILNVRIEPTAKSIIEKLPRMERGDYVSNAIIFYEKNKG